MDKLRQWIALTVVGALLIFVAGWFLLISPKHSEAANLRAQAVSKQSDNERLAVALRILKQQQADLPRKEADLAAVAAKIPAARALPSLIRALTTVSTGAGVELVTISPGATTLVAPVTPGAAPAGAPIATRRPAGAGGAAAGSLGTITVAMSVVGGYFQIEQFLNGLEGLPRAMRVVTITLAPGGSSLQKAASAATLGTSKTLTASITAQVYQAVGRAVLGANGLPVAPAAPVVPGLIPGTPVAPAPTGSRPATPSAAPGK